jgi:septal ring factor EnvC (AmiA/AmiB activator)
MTTLEHLTRQWRALTAARARRLAELKRLDELLRKLGAAIERERRNPCPTELTLH